MSFAVDWDIKHQFKQTNYLDVNSNLMVFLIITFKSFIKKNLLIIEGYSIDQE